MEEAEQNSATQEVAPQEAENQTPQEEPQQQAWEQKQERNWRAVRQELADLRRQNLEKDELLQKAIEMQQAAQNRSQEDPEPDPDEYISYGGIKKVTSKTVEPLQKEIEELKGQLAQQRQKELISNLRSQYKDFDDIVNPETIALFEEKEPELANTIAEMKDPYKMGIQTYKYIKALNLTADVPDKRHQKEAEKMLNKNSKTVQSPQSYEKRPMAQAFKMTSAEKSELYSEMMQYANMASSVPPM